MGEEAGWHIHEKNVVCLVCLLKLQQPIFPWEQDCFLAWGMFSGKYKITEKLSSQVVYSFYWEIGEGIQVISSNWKTFFTFFFRI